MIKTPPPIPPRSAATPATASSLRGRRRCCDNWLPVSLGGAAAMGGGSEANSPAAMARLVSLRKRVPSELPITCAAPSARNINMTADPSAPTQAVKANSTHSTATPANSVRSRNCSGGTTRTAFGGLSGVETMIIRFHGKAGMRARHR